MSTDTQRHLEEMGQVIVGEFSNFSVGQDGTVEGDFGRFVPVEKPAPLDTLVKAMRLAGLDTSEFKFQQYQVIVGNPFHGGRVDLRFPDQLAIKSWKYSGLHQLDLVLRSPFVCATEITTILKGRKE